MRGQGGPTIKRVRFGSAAWRRYLDALPRAGRPRPAVQRVVSRIVREVAREGDPALVRWTERLDRVRLRPSAIHMEPAEVRRRAEGAGRHLRRALAAIARRIGEFHRRQLVPGFRLTLGSGSSVEEVVT
ncbi:MAG TPA: histidinol dehydrogenase, partial [Vicinamibacteria bacterium]|nr:histidinol dehydrogenase [Vicinamibacteria bacterium]